MRNGTASVQIFDGPGRPFRLTAQPLPDTLGPGEVLVELTLGTVCGSDLHTVEGRREAPVPCVLGHEGVGRVVAAGTDRAALGAGTRVSWSLVDSCGECRACTAHGLPQKCGSLFKYGHAALSDGSGLNGCYATHVLLRPGTHFAAVPDAVPDYVAAPANCALATMVNVISQLPAACETVVIQGAGLLGLYGCALLKERGVTNVFCSDLSDVRLQHVPLFGGIPVQAGSTRYRADRQRILDVAPGGVDAVVEVAGNAAVVPEGVSLLRAGGYYAFAGMVHPNSSLKLTGEQIVRKCLTIRGTHNYSPTDLDRALDFLDRTIDTYPYETLVSPAYELADLERAFEMAKQKTYPRVAVNGSMS